MTTVSAMKVLLLDDDAFTLKLLVRMLSNLGVREILACKGGNEALSEINQAGYEPDVILCDLNMPEMDGLEFIRKLVECGYKGCLILASGEDERVLQTAAHLVRAHHITMLGHLKKPVTPDSLAEVLQKWQTRLQNVPPRPVKAYSADEVREAILGGQLVNYYQPQVAVSDGRVVAVETLVRWQHPVDGLVYPDALIGTAEEHGLIDDLTRVVLLCALAHARQWQNAGIRLRIAINVSMDNLATLRFPDFVHEHAMQAGVAPQDIVLEVTESRLMTDLRAPLEILTRLRLKQFHLSIDDFGTGHSSMAQLRDIPFNELKIDKGFVMGAHSNETIRAIYLASLNLAKQMDMTVVAEGVETQADLEFLRETGCDLAQGYLIARPMPMEKLADWITAWQRSELFATLTS